MSLMSTGLVAEARRQRRYVLNLPGLLSGPDGEQVQVWVKDISAGGCRIDLDGAEPVMAGPGWELDIPTLGTFPTVRCWRRMSTFGLSFALSDEGRRHLAARLARTVPRLG